jgi:hypothetical protein
VKSVERLAQLEADADARIGTDDPQEDRHELMIRQARDSMERYREIYEECLDAHPEHDDPPAKSTPNLKMMSPSRIRLMGETKAVMQAVRNRSPNLVPPVQVRHHRRPSPRRRVVLKGQLTSRSRARQNSAFWTATSRH